MISYVRWISVLMLVVAADAFGAGFIHDETFCVFTPAIPTQEAGQRFAQQVHQRAIEYRAEIAREWLGEELAPGTGRTVINVELSETEDSGLTWAKDHPDRIFHNVYLTTSADNAAGSTLGHEIAHTIFATRFPHPNRLPPWVEEGIACRYDDGQTKAARVEVISSWIRSRQMPRLRHLLEMPDIASFDDTSYAAGTSLVSFLVTRGDKQALLRFAEDGHRSSWDESLRSHYGMRDIDQLQTQWESWLAATGGVE